MDMDQRTGKYVTKKIPGESFQAYIPSQLPPKPALNLDGLYPLMERATLALAELNNAANTIPNISLFIYMYVRKEALLSSQIEGTQSSFSDLMLFEHHQKPEVSIEDVEEVSNYVKAIYHGLKRIRNGFPISLRLIKEIHEILLSGGRGSFQSPGEFRRSQNWIGGTRPGNARFVPPPVEHLLDCLSNLEKFLHNKQMPVLLKAGIAHLQFETIHPFLDGNGRLGRLLVILLLCDSGMLSEPILYFSLYLKQNRSVYYNLLQEVRERGNWETWLEFFLNGIYTSSKQGTETITKINDLFTKDLAKIATLGRAKKSAEQTLDYLKMLPQVSVVFLAKELDISKPTARTALNNLVKLNIIEEVSGQQRNKVYIYKTYLNLLEEGALPF